MKKERFSKWLLLFACTLVLVGIFSTTIKAAPLVGERFERTLGTGAVPDLVKQYGGEYILPIQERMWVEEVFRRLVAVTQRKEVEYTLTVLNSHEANAFALPGGYIFITRGLLSMISSSEAKLAAVLGHEIAHVENNHGINAVLRQMGLTILLEVSVMVIDFASADLIRLASATLLQLLQRGWGREAEFEADLVGQKLAVEAGFDPIGAISLLNDLFQANSEDLPMKIFRSHPDIIDRRARLEANLQSFWSKPKVITNQELIERLNDGRNSDQGGRNDPKGRYVVEHLSIFDKQTESHVFWVEYGPVIDYAWSPQGEYLAVLLDLNSNGELWLYDRRGHPIRQVVLSTAGQIKALSWSPEGQMLALDVKAPEGNKVLVTQAETEVFVDVSRKRKSKVIAEQSTIEVSGELTGKNSIWMDGGLYFIHEEQWYLTLSPEVQVVHISNPVPQVLQRRRILSPTVIREGNTFRLTRPSLTIP